MKELRPLGSEKLTGDAKIQRILEIANYGRTPKPSNINKPEYVTESNIGGVYGIVKEKDGFYVKKGLNESSLEYIGGMFMKNKNKFSSYGEAFKRLDFLKGQDNLQEATKYVLKQNNPNPPPPPPPMEAAPADPAMSEPTASDAGIPPLPTGDAPVAPEAPMGDEFGNEQGGDGQNSNLRSGYMSEIQKYAGKLGQELRDQKDKLESDDLKYTLNMIISAIDINKLDDDDLSDIADKFDRDEEEFDNQGSEEGSEEEFEEPAPPESEGELSEVTGDEKDDYFTNNYGEENDLDETMSKLDEFINSNVDGEEDIFSTYSDIGKPEEEEEEEEEEDDYFKGYNYDRNIEDIDPTNDDYYDGKDNDLDISEDDEFIDYDLMSKGDRFKYGNEIWDKGHLDPVKPRFRTKSVEDNNVPSRNKWNISSGNKEIDIDEISNAVNNAIRNSLSKYK